MYDGRPWQVKFISSTKQPSLLWKTISYTRKAIFGIEPANQCRKIIYSRNLRACVINCYGHLAHAYELAYFRNGRKLSRKLFMTLLPGPNVIKTFLRP